MSKRRIIPMTVVLVLLLSLVSCVAMIGRNMEKKVDELDQTEVAELSSVKDGIYVATAETTLVKVEVSVSVSDHRIIAIELLRHENGKGEKAETMIGEMVKRNTSEVEIVAGATMSSKVIRAAVRKALKQGV